MQVEGLLFIAKVLIESWNDFNEATHDKREEGHTSQHNEDAKDHLVARLWRQVTISDSRQRSDREVARCDHLVVAGRILQSVRGDEVRLLSVEETRYEVEEAADEVSDDDSE